MEQFTPVDWLIVGIVLAVGLAAATIKVFWFDDQNDSKD